MFLCRKYGLRVAVAETGEVSRTQTPQGLIDHQAEEIGVCLEGPGGPEGLWQLTQGGWIRR